MSIHKLAGHAPPKEALANIPRLMTAYYVEKPDSGVVHEKVAFGTSGHRGSSFKKSFNEAHVLAICQAVCDYRQKEGIDGPLFLGMDTHALSEAAWTTAVEVFAANGVCLRIQSGFGYTPTPVISHAILCANRRQAPSSGRADGVVITPSHNPPEDGGLKYNPPHGGPAGGEVTAWIQQRANGIIQESLKAVSRMSFRKALQAEATREEDFLRPYVLDLKNVLDMEIIADSGIKIGVDPMGGSGLAYWEPIAETYGLDLEVVNPHVDPSFSFMRLDKDGKIRMDCSSPYAMSGLIALKDRFDIAFGNDPDNDRHGIVAKSVGLMNPNHYLAVAISYLFRHRPGWPSDAGIGKTLVSSALIDRVASALERPLVEVPVGFKWFVEGLFDGRLGFAGEESAGGAFLRKNGAVWTTDKDGIILNLLAAEITAKTGRDPGAHYKSLEARFGAPVFQRIDSPASLQDKTKLARLSPEDVNAKMLAGEAILEKQTRAEGNLAAIGGIKVRTENGWFAARPSGTEDIYKIYAESFKGKAHLALILEEAQEMVRQALKNPISPPGGSK